MGWKYFVEHSEWAVTCQYMPASSTRSEPTDPFPLYRRLMAIVIVVTDSISRVILLGALGGVGIMERIRSYRKSKDAWVSIVPALTDPIAGSWLRYQNLGLGVTAWKFTYFDAPDGEGNEVGSLGPLFVFFFNWQYWHRTRPQWEATFNTPVLLMPDALITTEWQLVLEDLLMGVMETIRERKHSLFPLEFNPW